MLGCDSYFTIGSGHTVCQDYARASVLPSLGAGAPRAIAIVADGCSSSRHSDIGARLLVLSALESAKQIDYFEATHVVQQAAHVAGMLAADRECLDATLLMVHQRSDGRIQLWAAGDGTFAAVRRDGSLETWTLDCGGAPGYLSYLVDGARMRRYLAAGFGCRRMQRAVDGMLCEVVVSTVATAPVFRQAHSFVWTRDLEPSDYRMVMAMSDGVSSFTRTRPDGSRSCVRELEVVRQLVAIKTSRGEFLVRRCRRFLGRYCRIQQWSHSDDLATAALMLDGCHS